MLPFFKGGHKNNSDTFHSKRHKVWDRQWESPQLIEILLAKHLKANGYLISYHSVFLYMYGCAYQTIIWESTLTAEKSDTESLNNVTIHNWFTKKYICSNKITLFF